jgi:hypothetical protein
VYEEQTLTFHRRNEDWIRGKQEKEMADRR